MSDPKAIVLVVMLLTGALPARAQTSEGPTAAPKLVATWQASNATCKDKEAAALAAIAACEQRDTLSKRLAQLNYCYGQPDASGTTVWRACASEVAAGRDGTQVALHRAGGVFVLPVTLNGTAKAYGIVDSGATHVQVPEETVEEMRRDGTLSDADFLGQRRYTLADGRAVQQKVFRLRTVQIGERAMANVTASVGAPRSRVLLGQSFLRRLAGWKVDNVRNTLELEFSGPP